MSLAATPSKVSRVGTTQPLPRIGFVGAGWIGRSRMKAIVEQQKCEVAGIVEPQTDLAQAARALTSERSPVCSFEELLGSGIDGIVIATPNFLHAEQSIAALERGIAVFCQKPVGRNTAETLRVVTAARRADRLLAVDLSYRFVHGIQKIRELVQSGALGRVYAAELTFHNAYGPDKPWFYDPAQSGGGCLLDLGIHLVDLALWMFRFPEINGVSGSLYSQGKRSHGPARAIEDYAAADLKLAGGISVHLACSWKAHAGRDAVIEVQFYGTQGGAALRNVNGSFFDFVAERFRGTQCETLTEPPDDWGGRAALDWLARLQKNNRFDAQAEELVAVADALDRIYAS